MPAIQPQTIPVIGSASASIATSWLLTSTGVAVDTQTITIAGIVFTSVNPIGTTAGNVLVDASASAFITNLVTLINAPTVTTATGVALSDADAAKIKTLGITATKTSATLMTLTSSVVKLGGNVAIVVSETETNFAWTTVATSAGFGGNVAGRASLQFTAASITSGNAVFTVEASNDATNWLAYNRLTTNVTNTNGQTDTRVASVTLSSNTSSLVTLPDPFAFYRVIATITTDGTYTATAYII